jgi:PTH1 family peptidyl-tRNA hydrolase
MFFIFGLGNPGRKYRYTLHNLGFWTLDEIALRYNVGFKRRICNSRLTHLKFKTKARCSREVYLIKPYTYMNLSGKAVLCLRKKYEFDFSQMLVICDDINLEKGYIKIKQQGSSGGHKGLASIIEALGTEKFPRLRIGTGPLGDRDPKEYVLQSFGSEDILEYHILVQEVVKIVEFYLREGIQKAMSFYNRKKII